MGVALPERFVVPEPLTIAVVIAAGACAFFWVRPIWADAVLGAEYSRLSDRIERELPLADQERLYAALVELRHVVLREQELTGLSEKGATRMMRKAALPMMRGFLELDQHFGASRIAGLQKF